MKCEDNYINSSQYKNKNKHYASPPYREGSSKENKTFCETKNLYLQTKIASEKPLINFVLQISHTV